MLTRENALIPFLFEGEGLVRVVMRDAEPWFVAADVCRILGIKNTADGLKNLDDDEKGIALSDTLRGIQEVLVVSESGLWTLVLRSRDAVSHARYASIALGEGGGEASIAWQVEHQDEVHKLLAEMPTRH